MKKVLIRIYYIFQNLLSLDECDNIIKEAEQYVKTYMKKVLIRIYYIFQNLLSLDECDNIIKEAEQYAINNDGWITDRHAYYPTTDNEITSTWTTYNNISSHIYKKIFPKIANMYSIKSSNLGVNELFIAKYSHNEQYKLNEHEDGSEFSFIIALNDNFKGGGTHFVHDNNTIKLNKGACLVFSGQNTHSGLTVTSGTRYILTGFINYKYEGYCDEII